MESVKQEKKDLGKMPGDFKQMSTGSWMSKHISSPLGMGKAHSMAPKMEKGSAVYMKDEDFKGKKPDANKNGVPDYAEDGKGKS